MIIYGTVEFIYFSHHKARQGENDTCSVTYVTSRLSYRTFHMRHLFGVTGRFVLATKDRQYIIVKYTTISNFISSADIFDRRVTIAGCTLEPALRQQEPFRNLA